MCFVCNSGGGYESSASQEIDSVESENIIIFDATKLNTNKNLISKEIITKQQSRPYFDLEPCSPREKTIGVGTRSKSYPSCRSSFSLLNMFDDRESVEEKRLVVGTLKPSIGIESSGGTVNMVHVELVKSKRSTGTKFLFVLILQKSFLNYICVPSLLSNF